MRSSDRRRRRDERPGHEPEPAAPALAPDIASILALQRTAGNRALARLVFNTGTRALVVPKDYAMRQVTYKDTTRSLSKHAGDADSDFKDHLATGLQLNYIEKVSWMEDQTLRTNVEKMATDGPSKKDTAKQLGDVAVDPNRLLKFDQD